MITDLWRKIIFLTEVSALRRKCKTHVMLFWWRVSRVLLRSSVVALLSILRKRSMAEILRWMLCFGMSNLDMKVKFPPSSKLNSIGQQSWPFTGNNINMYYKDYFCVKIHLSPHWLRRGLHWKRRSFQVARYKFFYGVT